MKKVVFVVIAAFLGFMFLGGQAIAAPSLHLNWGSELNVGKCPEGDLVINVIQQITNDIDSGEGGNYWAYDAFNRRIQVWDVDNGDFCAEVQYSGSFTTAAGLSPGNTDTIAAGIEGTFQGGYRATINGSLASDPPYRTKGNIGKFDYDCDHLTGNCTSYVNWVAAYFEDGYSFNYEWWGWVYHGGKNGTWVNSSDGNEGDITD
jgi:hypothetical protein